MGSSLGSSDSVAGHLVTLKNHFKSENILISVNYVKENYDSPSQ